MASADFKLAKREPGSREPVRVVVLQEDERPAVEFEEEELVMTFPHLVVRELITLIGASLVLVLASVLFDAPLEELANPQQTPNPAKAPWYFLGLQELLHYYPPIVSGVILPGLMVVALAVIPYFEVNLKRESFWKENRNQRLLYLGIVTLLLCLVFGFTAAHPMWPVIVPSLLIAGLIASPALMGPVNPLLRWLETRSLAFWTFTWFLSCGFVLTIIGIFFRGPGWAFTLPWRDGVF